MPPSRPNLVFIFADQWRASAAGFAGDPNVKTPHIDRLAAESVRFSTSVSNCPICTPYRASLLTGQYPLTTGLFMNDLCLSDRAVSFARVLRDAEYDTAYIGKWHLDGHGRTSFIPRERRQGFDYWKVLECTHQYMASPYYANDDETLRTWEGYDVFAQTRDAAEYMTQHARVQAEKPFALFLSYGPPHNPYHTAPEEYRAHYPPDELVLPPNVHPDCAASARRDLAGYYAHIHAMDDAIGRIIASLSQLSLLDNTLVVLTSDHGDSVWSHCLPQTGNINKQRPYDESILTPFLMRCPASMPIPPRVVADPFATPDVMPTLLDLLNLPIPDTVEGVSLADTVRETITGAGADSVSSFSRKREGVLIAAYAPFADWSKDQGGVPYRGIRTERYTYVKTREKFWMLFDNRDDPYQRCNRIDDPGMKSLREHLDRQLDLILAEQGDDFPDAEILYARYGYHGVNAKGIIPFAKGEEWYIRAAELAEAYRRG